MSNIIEERFERQAAIEEFGDNRVREAVLNLYRNRGLSILNDNAQEQVLRALEADQQLADRIIADNRRTRLATLKDGDIDPTTGCMVVRMRSWDDFGAVDRAVSAVTGKPAAISKEA